VDRAAGTTAAGRTRVATATAHTTAITAITATITATAIRAGDTATRTDAGTATSTAGTRTGTAATTATRMVMATATGTTEAPLPRPGTVAIRLRGLPLALAVAVPVLLDGGFTPASRSLFTALAAIAVSVALVEDERPVLALLSSPSVLCLLALAALAVLSSAWTLGDPAAALRWGLVIASLAAVALAAGHEASRGRIAALAAIIAGLAALEAAVGLVSAALRVTPDAERIGGTWRPGGTFQYPPALALLQVSALPILLWVMARSRFRLGITAAAGAGLAGAAIALAASRAETGLGLAVLALAIAFAERTLGVSRRATLAAASIPIGAGVVAHFAAGGYAWPGQTGGGLGRLAILAGIPLVSAAAWGVTRRHLGAPASGSEVERRLSRLSLLVGGAVVALAGLFALATFAHYGNRPWVEPADGLTHGRTAEWNAAVLTATRNPVTGAGADAFAAASAGEPGKPASLYAHELPLEAWAELGPLGLALVLCLYGSVVSLLWKVRRHPMAWLFAPAVAAFLLANLVDWPWHLAGSGAVWALALGACLALRRSDVAGA
jgi:O-antigen ligase